MMTMPAPDERGFVIYSKKDVIRGHLNDAILLFFRESNISSVHTLAAAALEMLKSIAKKEGIAFGLDIERAVPTHLRGDFRKNASAPKNFFKHADRDADALYRFHSMLTEFELMQAEDAYGTVYGHITYPMSIFRLWFLNEVGKKSVVQVEEVAQQLAYVGISPENFTKQIALGFIMGKEGEEIPSPRDTRPRPTGFIPR
jgi:hypothetical protein